MEITFEQIHSLVEHIISKWKEFKVLNHSQRFIIAICGVPGSGKTTIAKEISHALNESLSPNISTVLPMDGYHFYREHLYSLPNAQEAIEQRGALWTFDKSRFLREMRWLRESPEKKLYFPCFEHNVKDPQEKAICVEPFHEIVIVEGLYCCLSTDDEWGVFSSEIPHLRIGIAASLEVCQERVVHRHLESGIYDTKEEALHKWLNSDYQNALFVLQNSHVDWWYRNSVVMHD